MNELISVIVPVYKVEDYLKRCIDSILRQTYGNLEIILVDDGSPDGCCKICDEYAERDKRVKVIHKENGGLSDARNAGIDIAQGSYVAFIDSDDWVHDKYIEKLYQLLKKTAADISVCNYMETSREDIPQNNINGKIYEFSNVEALEQLTNKLYLQMVVAWGKLYKKDLFNEIRFPEGKIHEDEFTSYRVIYKARKVVFTTERLIYYWQRPDSIMGSGFNVKHHLDVIQAYKERAEFFNDVGLKCLGDKTYKGLFYIYKDVMEKQAALNETDDKQEIIEGFKSLRSKLREGKHNFKFKVGYELYYIFPGIMGMVYRTYEWLQKLNWNNMHTWKGLTMKRVSSAYKALKKYVPVPVKKYIQNVCQNPYYSNVLKEFKNGGTRRIILMGTPEHGNLGDHAIAEAELKLLHEYLHDCQVIEITGEHYRSHKKSIAERISDTDIIAITGGGFLGSLWPVEENMVRDIIGTFANNKIVVFPQTIYFEDGANGRFEFEITKNTYQQHKDLTLCLRDAASYEIARNMIVDEKAGKLLLVPDIALYLDKTDSKSIREGILLCLREDKERVISQSQRENIERMSVARDKKIDYTSTVIPIKIKKEARSVEIEKKLDEFRRAELVITDRLHGMIFAAITGTPCIALDNSSGKVKGVYAWIENIGYIKFAETVEEIPALMDKLLDIKLTSYNNTALMADYKKIIDLLYG